MLQTSAFKARQACGEINPLSRASMRWYSDSEADLIAICRNRANSLAVSAPQPSAIVADIEPAERTS